MHPKLQQTAHLIRIEGGRQPLLGLRRAHILRRGCACSSPRASEIGRTSAPPTTAVECCAGRVPRRARPPRRSAPARCRARSSGGSRADRKIPATSASRVGTRQPYEGSYAVRSTDAPRNDRSRRAVPNSPRDARAPQRVSAWVTSSPIRERNSVLMAGWNRSMSLAPMARMPNAPFEPRGVSATEPISIESFAEEKVALRIADLSASRLARLQQGLEGLHGGVGRVGGSQEAARRGLQGARFLEKQHQHRISGVEILAQARLDGVDRCPKESVRGSAAELEPVDALGERVIGASHVDQLLQLAFERLIAIAQHLHLALHQTHRRRRSRADGASAAW